ncbi:HupE/UreJ family protein [Candidatus Pelagibacter sp.]|jgi:urease accessory protein|nr:HupE/UreJ family protein [Candidatus Pelagibacter sp.]|tara:strand:+ start:82 stop:681 length:600 start_codon:yes stop_codon:yes gene_type:complete
MNKKIFISLIYLSFYPLPVLAHNITGKLGFYDGLSHPVLGLDHLLAMICVGILSAQIGGKAIWTVPTTFVTIMTIGGLLGFLLIIDEFYFVEVGIVFSVILLGFGISIEKKIPVKLIMIFVGIFGLFHGIAHGLEVPAAANPVLFVLGFIFGTTTLHLLGVAIGYFSIKKTISLILLRLTGVSFSIYGIYLLNEILYYL